MTAMKKPPRVKNRKPTSIYLGRSKLGSWGNGSYEWMAAQGKPKWDFVMHGYLVWGDRRSMSVCPTIVRAAGIRLRKGQIVELKVTVVKA